MPLLCVGGGRFASGLLSCVQGTQGVHRRRQRQGPACGPFHRRDPGVSGGQGRGQAFPGGTQGLCGQRGGEAEYRRTERLAQGLGGAACILFDHPALYPAGQAVAYDPVQGADPSVRPCGSEGYCGETQDYGHGGPTLRVSGGPGRGQSGCGLDLCLSGRGWGRSLRNQEGSGDCLGGVQPGRWPGPGPEVRGPVQGHSRGLGRSRQGHEQVGSESQGIEACGLDDPAGGRGCHEVDAGAARSYGQWRSGGPDREARRASGTGRGGGVDRRRLRGHAMDRGERQ